MTWAKRTDATHAAVRDTLRALGLTVLDLSRVGGGCGDLLVAADWLESTVVEVKAKAGKLRASQQKFQRDWPRPYVVLRSADEAVAWVREQRKEAAA